jgi:cobalamin biosynthetic protein CobC
VDFLTMQAKDFGPCRHGGDLAAARRAFPMAPEPWLDLSTGINPYFYPLSDLPLEVFTRIPEPGALFALERAARRAYRVPQACDVLAASGSQALVGLLPLLLPLLLHHALSPLLAARRIGIFGFTYAEHEASWRAAGYDVTIVEDLGALESMDVAIIVNPNNPDGRLVPVRDLCALAGVLTQRGGLLVLDEAFVDFLEPSASLVPFMPDAGVVVLRSFGKTYGLPGLRLGFAIVPRALASALRPVLGPWPVCGAALAIGTAALADETWRRATHEKLRIAGAALDEVLTGAGLTVSGGSILYRLVTDEDAKELFESLGRAGILVRRFEAKPNWLRLAIPASEIDRMRLSSTLRSVRGAAARASAGIGKQIDPIPNRWIIPILK